MATDKLLKQLQKNRLNKLDLSGKTLTLARAQIIVEALSHVDCKLKKLDLSHCLMAESEAEAILVSLARAIQKNKSLTEVGLVLDVDFTDNVIQALKQALNLNHSLTSFQVNLKRIPPMTLHTITSALQDNQMLQEKATVYTPQFFKSGLVASRHGSAEHIIAKQVTPLHP